MENYYSIVLIFIIFLLQFFYYLCDRGDVGPVVRVTSPSARPATSHQITAQTTAPFCRHQTVCPCRRYHGNWWRWWRFGSLLRIKTRATWSRRHGDQTGNGSAIVCVVHVACWVSNGLRFELPPFWIPAGLLKSLVSFLPSQREILGRIFWPFLFCCFQTVQLTLHFRRVNFKPCVSQIRKIF